jgi:membrane protein implicated in regulation of membrane protease activity
MSISKTAFLSILIACWIVGLLNQFQDWDTALKYLLLSGLMVAAAALRWQYSRQVSKAKIPRRRD